MDKRLGERLKKLEEQIDEFYRAEENYLTLDAAKDHTLSTIASGVGGPELSEATRTRLAKGSGEWLKFCSALAIAEAEFHRQRHVLDLKQRAFDAEYLTMKVEAPVISRQGRVG